MPIAAVIYGKDVTEALHYSKDGTVGIAGAEISRVYKACMSTCGNLLGRKIVGWDSPSGDTRTAIMTAWHSEACT